MIETTEVNSIEEMPIENILDLWFEFETYTLSNRIASYSYTDILQVYEVTVISNEDTFISDRLRDIITQKNIAFLCITKRCTTEEDEIIWRYRYVSQESKDNAEADYLEQKLINFFGADSSSIDNHIKSLKERGVEPTELSNYIVCSGFFNKSIGEYLDKTYEAIKEFSLFESPIMDLKTKEGFWKEILKLAQFRNNV